MGNTFYFSDVCRRGWPCGSFGWSGSQIRIGAPVPYIALYSALLWRPRARAPVGMGAGLSGEARPVVV